MAVSNEDEFRAWLEEQPREVCIAIAWRAAMRAVPFATVGNQNTSASAQSILTQMRNLVSVIVALSRQSAQHLTPSSELSVSKEETEALQRAARSGASQATVLARMAAFYAQMVIHHSDPAKQAIKAVNCARNAAVYSDAILTRDLGQNPLFALSVEDRSDVELGELPDRISQSAPVVEKWKAISASAGSTDFFLRRGPWTFWAEWYDRAMAGEPLPWELQERVALIPDEVWEAGPEAVAAEIEKIRARFDAAQAAKELREEMALAGDRPVPASFGDNSQAMAYDPHADELSEAGIGRAEFNALVAAIDRLARVAEEEPPTEAETQDDADTVEGNLDKLLRYFAKKLSMDFDAFRAGFWGAAGAASFVAVSGALFAFTQKLGALLQLVKILIPVVF